MLPRQGSLAFPRPGRQTLWEKAHRLRSPRSLPHCACDFLMILSPDVRKFRGRTVVESLVRSALVVVVPPSPHLSSRIGQVLEPMRVQNSQTDWAPLLRAHRGRYSPANAAPLLHAAGKHERVGETRLTVLPGDSKSATKQAWRTPPVICAVCTRARIRPVRPCDSWQSPRSNRESQPRLSCSPATARIPS